MNLTILHTNDLHGRVPQLERIATLVRRIKAEVRSAGGYCIYVDGGDAEDTTLLESSLTKGSAMNAILRGAGCEYVSLGNAIPIRYGEKPIADMAAAFGRPILCANLSHRDGSRIQGLEPFTITEVNGHKIGIIGLTDPTDGYETFFKLKTYKPLDILPEMIASIRAQGAKTVILLSHLGSQKDAEIAKKAQGLDVIIGAHDHQMISPPLETYGTLIAQAGEHGKYLGRLDLTLEPATGKVTSHHGKLIPINETIPPDPEAQNVVRSEQARIQKMMVQVIGKLETPIELADDRECAAGNLLADALLERIAPAQISVVLAGHWETGLNKGPLTQGELFTAIRSTANPAWKKLNGAQIKQFLREALKLENAERKIHALRGRAIGMPHIAGAQIQYDPNDGHGIAIKYQGKILGDEDELVVASTDMEFSDYIGYLVIPFEEVEFEVPTIMPEVLEDYIKKQTPLSSPPSRTKRI